MKTRALTAFLAFSVVLFSCKKDEKEETPTPTESVPAIRVNISNEVDGTVITTGDYLYTNEAGEPYGVGMLKYYLSYFTLIKDDGTEVVLNDHKLVDGLNTSNNFLIKSGIPEGNYTSVKFYIGVDEVHNHTGAQEGDLDPINGMLWTWNTGYIFFKHEGQYRKADQSSAYMTYHWATDQMYQSIELPISFTQTKEEKTLKLTFNLNDLYRTPNVVTFEGNDLHQSLAAGDHDWLYDLKENFLTAFTVEVVS